MKHGKASLWFILFTVFLDMVGLGIVIPVLPDVIRRFSEDPEFVSRNFGYFFSIYALMQFVSSPVLGALSDSIGRRPVLLVSLALAAADYLMMGFAPSLALLFLGRVVSGLTGANFTVAMAYIADVSEEDKRAQNFGMIGAAFGLGFIVGPAIGGLLAHAGKELPFVVAAGLNFLNFIYGILVLPESLSPELRRKFSAKAFNPFAPFKSIFKFRSLQAFFVCHFLTQLAGLTHPSIWTLYTETRYGWSKSEVGLSLAAVGVCSAFSQGYLTKILVRAWGEHKAMVIGTFSVALFMAMFGFAWQGWMIYAILLASTFSWVAQPALQSLIAKGVDSSRQGELQGILVSLTSLAAILNPVIVTQLFAQFGKVGAVVYIPGAPYFFASLVSLVAWFTMLGKVKSPSLS